MPPPTTIPSIVQATEAPGVDPALVILAVILIVVPAGAAVILQRRRRRP